MGDKSQMLQERNNELSKLPGMHLVKAFNTVLWSSGKNVI